MKACLIEGTSGGCAGHVVDGEESDFGLPKGSSFWTGPVVFILAKWHPAGLALFDTEAWGDPEVHASAAAEVLAGAQVLSNGCAPAHAPSCNIFRKSAADNDNALICAQ